MRPTSAVVDLEALKANAAELARRAAPADLCAVVKADGYGHGSVAAGRAALAGGATWLAVALVEEGVELRRAGVTAPILLLSEPRPNEMVEVVAHALRPSVYSAEGLAAAAAAAAGANRRLPVHLKIDTGMNRVGVHPDDALMLAGAVAAKVDLDLEGVWTHCAVADELDNPFTDEQLARYEAVLGLLGSRDDIPGPLVRHAANSAAPVAWCTVAFSGYPPDQITITPKIICKNSRFSIVNAGPTNSDHCFDLLKSITNSPIPYPKITNASSRCAK